MSTYNIVASTDETTVVTEYTPESNARALISIRARQNLSATLLGN
jgi:hypothetical protein